MIVQVKVIPNAPETEFRGTMIDGTMKIAVHAGRERGVANTELCRFLAHHFHCSKDVVRVLRGKTSTRKVVEVRRG